jgi:hypothetical protein
MCVKVKFSHWEVGMCYCQGLQGDRRDGINGSSRYSVSAECGGGRAVEGKGGGGEERKEQKGGDNRRKEKKKLKGRKLKKN